MIKDVPSRPEMPTDQVAEIRHRQRHAVWVTTVSVFLGAILVGMGATVTFDWPKVVALPIAVIAFPTSVLAVTVVDEFYNWHISRLWKRYNAACDHYWKQRGS